MLDPLYKLALETIEKNKQAIIFVPSRASAEKTAEEISKLTNFQYPEFEQAVLKAASTPTKQCRRLSHIIKKGVAFHHAGLLSKQKDLIENEFRTGKIKIIAATPTLCLSGDTLIWQPDGNTLVKYFKNSNLFALSQSKLRVMKAKKVNKNQNSQKLIKITSVSGHSIKLTPNHKILVKRGKKKELINAAECKSKDKIATVGRLNLEKTTKPKISDFVEDNELPIFDRKLTAADFYFIGSMLGDGHSGAETRDGKIHYKASPSFTSNDFESIDKIIEISKCFHSIHKQRLRFGSISLVLSKTKWLREFLCRCGVEIGINKYIHNDLMQADLKLIKHLIQGLFDTDGCVENLRHLSFSNISIRLIRDLQKLLLRFGIVSRLRERSPSFMQIISKRYQTKKSFELVISQNRSIYLFYKLIGFNLTRKQVALRRLIRKISQVLFSECKNCEYRIHSSLFSGRTREQQLWGKQKLKIITILAEKKELGSRELQKELGFCARKKDTRLNHHYFLISKRRIGSKSSTEWYWRLNQIGLFLYKNIICKEKDITEFFNFITCPICETKLTFELRKKWRDSDFDGDIFWDYVRSVKEVEVEEDVYDVVLPDKPNNDHLFVANGFIVHNSAGLSLPAYRVIIKSLKRYSGSWGMDWIPVLEYLQMAGRAGRPEYEKEGQAITLAKSEHEKKEIYETYVLGEPEEIYSKLAVEPVLRTYLLSLISSGIIKDKESMQDFFSRTFWAHQFADLKQLNLIMDKMLLLLEGWNFVRIIDNENSNSNDDKHNKDKEDYEFIPANKLNQKTNNEKKLRPTLLGKRISELYLDPLTAKHLLDCLSNYNLKNSKRNTFSLLQMISHTLEMRPLLRIKSKEQDKIQEELVKNYEQLLKPEPSAFDLEYNEFMNSIKTTLFFEAWINEKDEDFLMETCDIRPGEIRIKLEIADWLLYAGEELSKILNYREALNELRKLRIRIKNGIKEDLLPLIKLKNIGRVRARKLINNGIKDLGDLKRMDLATLSQILGEAVAKDVKEQLGEEIKEIPEGKRIGQLSIKKF